MITYASVYIQRDATKRTNILASCGGFHCTMGCESKNAKMNQINSMLDASQQVVAHVLAAPVHLPPLLNSVSAQSKSEHSAFASDHVRSTEPNQYHPIPPSVKSHTHTYIYMNICLLLLQAETLLVQFMHSTSATPATMKSAPEVATKYMVS